MPDVMPAPFDRSVRPEKKVNEGKEVAKAAGRGRVVDAEFRVNEGAPWPREPGGTTFYVSGRD